jgi:hypothetical protein
MFNCFIYGIEFHRYVYCFIVIGDILPLWITSCSLQDMESGLDQVIKLRSLTQAPNNKFSPEDN